VGTDEAGATGNANGSGSAFWGASHDRRNVAQAEPAPTLYRSWSAGRPDGVPLLDALAKQGVSLVEIEPRVEQQGARCRPR
jgi:hypothetical protein